VSTPKVRKKRKQAHTVAPMGKRVLVFLKTGEKFVDKFKGKKGRRVFFEEHCEYTANIKSMTIYRHASSPKLTQLCGSSSLDTTGHGGGGYLKE
jgi:hypothetical protein